MVNISIVEGGQVMNYVIPIITLIVGLVGGFFIGVFYLRKQLEKMQNDPQMLQKMAKQMGYNMNGKQMQRAQQMMKNQPMPGKGQGRKRKS
jgi:uncharacterized protein YneF (UPF0154 family)